MKKRIFTALIATMLLFAMCVGTSADFEVNADKQSQESVQPRYREYLEVTRSCSLYSKNPCDYGTGAYNKIICYLEPGDTLDMRICAIIMWTLTARAGGAVKYFPAPTQNIISTIHLGM